MPMNRRGSVAVNTHSPLVESFVPGGQSFASPRRASIIEPKVAYRPNMNAHLESDDLMSRLQLHDAKADYNTPPEPTVPSVLKTGIMLRQHPYCPHCGHHVQVIENSHTATDSESSNRSRSNSSQVMHPADEISPASLLSPLSFRSTTSSQRRACAPLPSETTASPRTPADWQHSGAPRSASLTHPPLVSPREQRRLTRQLRANSEVTTDELRKNVAQWMQRSADFSGVPSVSLNALGLSVEDTTSDQGSRQKMASLASSPDSDQPGSAPPSLGAKSPLREAASRREPASRTAAAVPGGLQDSAVSTPTEQAVRSVPLPAAEADARDEANVDTPTTVQPTASRQNFPFLELLPGPGYPSNEPESKLSSLYLRRQARQNSGMDAALATSSLQSEEQAHTDDTPPELVSHHGTNSSCLSSRRPSHASTALLNDTAMHNVESSGVADDTSFASHLPMTSKIPDHDEDMYAPTAKTSVTNFDTGEDISRNDLMSSLAEAVEVPPPEKPAKQGSDGRRLTFSLRSQPPATFGSSRQQVGTQGQHPVQPTPRSVKFQTDDANALLQQSRVNDSVDSLTSDSTSQTARRRGSGNASGMPAPFLSPDIAPKSISAVKSQRPRGYSLGDTKLVPDINNFVSDAIEEQAAVMTSRPVSMVDRQRRASQGDALYAPPTKQNRFSRRFSKIPDSHTPRDGSSTSSPPPVPPMPAGILRQPQLATPPAYAEPKTPRANAIAERAMSKAGESANDTQMASPRRRASFANLIRSRRSSSVSQTKVAIPGVTPK